MKKVFILGAFLLMASCMFADVSGKKGNGSNVEVTFYCEAPYASKVLLAGDFTAWQNEAIPMIKSGRGFSITKTFDKDEVLIYKFIIDGEWTIDANAPQFADDGYGGKNSKVTVNKLLTKFW